MLCDTPKSTANGRLIDYDNSSSNSFRLGTNVSYQCNDELIPNEEKISTCINVLGEAKWIIVYSAYSYKRYIFCAYS